MAENENFAPGEQRRPRLEFLFGRLTVAATALGAVVALGQSVTTWINGYYQAGIEREETARELHLAEIKDTAALAESHIKLIIDKDTAPQDQVMLLGALSQLKDHPLQQWAKARYDLIQKNIDELNKAYTARADATQLKSEDEKKEATLRAEIQALNAQRELNRDNVVKTDSIEKEIVAKSGELAFLRGNIAVASATIETKTVTISQGQQTGIVTTSTDLGESIAILSNKITVDLVMSVFPETARSNVAINAKFLAAAMREFQIADPRLAAIIIATIAVETPTFEAYEEPQASFNTKVVPFDKYDNRLGNTEPGDGAKFRGRGYIGLTGKANYAAMSARLGLGTRLIDNPEDAKSPEVLRVLHALTLSTNSLNFSRRSSEAI